MKSAIFYSIVFFGEVSPENFSEISQFFRKSVSENATKLDFFFHDLSKALKKNVV